MKQKKTLKRFYSIASLVLCILLVFSVFAFASCDSSSSGKGDAEETEECRDVVRVKKGIPVGKQIAGEHLELVSVPISSIPDGALSSTAEIVGKYAAIDMVVGEYVFERMLTTEAPIVEEGDVIYVVVSDEISKANERDITADLQALIDKNPGRTIYFNDGVYTISSTIYLPTDKEKAVSFRLSNYAVIKAADTWNAESAMIALGAKNEAGTAERAANTIMGGKLDGAGVAKCGISVENCANLFVSNLTLEKFHTSLWIKDSADTVNIEGVTVNGNGAADSIGILNDSSRGVFSTTNITNVNTGLKNSGSDNNFRNISVKCLGTSTESVGFYDAGGKNIFELCTSEDFSCGYFIKDGLESVFEACNAYWTKADVAVQNAFVADGTFNSTITASVARFFDDSSENAYIKYTTAGSGVVKFPLFEENLCDDNSYQTVLAGTVIPLN